VEVTWKDPQGRSFSTNGAFPRATDFFEILETASYEANEKGEPTKKMKIRFSCTLSDGSKVIHIDNAEAVIGVSHN
jgi:hypothetical protein